MIRPLTFLSLVAAAGSGLHLYSVKHEVSQLERTLRDTVGRTEAARERTAVLRAEWAMLNEPERLRAAAARNLPLEAMQTAQFVRPSDLDRRLPVAVAFAGAPSLFAPAERQAERIAVASAEPEAAPPPVLAPVPAAAAPAARAAMPALVASAAAAPAIPAPPRAAPSPMSAQVAAARPVPPAERAAPPVSERVAAVVPPLAPAPAAERPARVPPSHLPQLAGVRTAAREVRPVPPEIRETASLRAPEPPRAAPRAPVEARAPEPRTPETRAPVREAERDIDRGMNVAASPPPGLLRTALHMRSAAAAVPPPRAPEPIGAGSMLGGAARPSLAPPVPVASASAATLDRLR